MSKTKKEKEAKTLYILGRLKPLMAKELSKRNIKYKDNIFDITYKFVTQVLKQKLIVKKKTFEGREELEPILIAAIISAAASIIGHIINYFRTLKTKEAENTLADIDKNLPNVEDVDDKGNIVMKQGKIPADTVIGKDANVNIDINKDGEIVYKSSFSSGMSVAFILILVVVVVYLLKK